MAPGSLVTASFGLLLNEINKRLLSAVREKIALAMRPDGAGFLASGLSRIGFIVSLAGFAVVGAGACDGSGVSTFGSGGAK